MTVLAKLWQAGGADGATMVKPMNQLATPRAVAMPTAPKTKQR